MSNLLSILGSLPASDSVKGKLNGLDFQKMVRMFSVVFAGAFFLAFGGSLASACNAESCDLSGGIAIILQSALQAGLTAGVASVVEGIRRKYAAAFQG